jgi:hypothetical protein
MNWANPTCILAKMIAVPRNRKTVVARVLMVSLFNSRRYDLAFPITKHDTNETLGLEKVMWLLVRRKDEATYTHNGGSGSEALWNWM